MTLAIETVGLTKSFGDTRALAGVDLQIKAGSVYGLLGPNGAGKTTTIRMLTTLIRPTAVRRRCSDTICGARRMWCGRRSRSPASSLRWMRISPASKTWC
jgi:ABC-type branched-subunit amino acid transport system ATPase component